MNQKNPYKIFQFCILLGGWIVLSSLLGCLSITTPTNGNGPNGSGDGFGNGGDPTGDMPAVELAVSNMNPQVGEEVTLTCTIISGQTNDSGQAIDPVFEFQPTDRLISIDTANGSAIFLINETDTSIEFVFTCSVTDASVTDMDVTSDPSLPVSIIPTASFSEP